MPGPGWFHVDFPEVQHNTAPKPLDDHIEGMHANSADTTREMIFHRLSGILNFANYLTTRLSSSQQRGVTGNI